MRERVRYMPARKQALIGWLVAAVAFVVATVVEHNVSGTGATVFWSIMTFLLGLAAGLALLNSRR